MSPSDVRPGSCYSPEIRAPEGSARESQKALERTDISRMNKETAAGDLGLSSIWYGF